MPVKFVECRVRQSHKSTLRQRIGVDGGIHILLENDKGRFETDPNRTPDMN
jgi:hypothetical protein